MGPLVRPYLLEILHSQQLVIRSIFPRQIHDGEQLPRGAQDVPSVADALRHLRRGAYAQEHVHAAI